MSPASVTAIRGAMTKAAVAAALVAALQGVAVPAVATSSAAGAFSTDAPTGPDDPACIQMPTDPVCEGGPYWQGPPPPPPPPAAPTGPLDPQCAVMPADAACLGSPYAPPPPPVEAPPPPVEAPPPVDMPIAPRRSRRRRRSRCRSRRRRSRHRRRSRCTASDSNADGAAADVDAVTGNGRHARSDLEPAQAQDSLRTRGSSVDCATSPSAAAVLIARCQFRSARPPPRDPPPARPGSRASAPTPGRRERRRAAPVRMHTPARARWPAPSVADPPAGDARRGHDSDPMCWRVHSWHHHPRAT